MKYRPFHLLFAALFIMVTMINGHAASAQSSVSAHPMVFPISAGGSLSADYAGESNAKINNNNLNGTEAESLFVVGDTKTDALAAQNPSADSVLYQAWYKGLDGLTAVWLYNIADADFEQPSSEMSLRLAQASMALSASAYDQALVDQSLRALHFVDLSQVNYRAATKDDNDFVALTIAHKTIQTNGKAEELFAVVIRGTTRDDAWQSNFNIGQGEVHKGFQLAERGAFRAFEDYYESMIALGRIDADMSNNKLWITGHSRGAAVANLLAADIVDKNVYTLRENLYAYTFACPNVTTKDTSSKNYSGIFNFNNSADFVCCVPLDAWDYRRYGNTVFMDHISGAQDSMEAVFEQTTHVAYDGATADSNRELIELIETVAPTVERYYSNFEGMWNNPAGISTVDTPSQYFEGIADVLAKHYVIGATKAILEAYDSVTLQEITFHFIKDNVLSKHIIHAHAPDAYLAWIDVLAASEDAGKNADDAERGAPATIDDRNIQYMTDTLDVDISYPFVTGLADANLGDRINSFLEGEAREAEQQAIDSAEKYSPDYQYCAYVSYEVERNDGVCLSIYLDIYIEAEGVHGAERILCVNALNQADGRLLSLADLFDTGFDYVGYLDACIAEQIAADEELSGDCDFTTVGEDRQFYLTGSELVVIFQEAEISSYVLGVLLFPFPLDEDAPGVRVEV